jgi:hypothetical protein
MNILRSRLVMAALAAGTLLATSPAFAFVAVECTAKNSAGKKYTSEIFGWFEWDSRVSATSYAMAACKAGSKNPASCTISVCTKTHA